MSTIAIHTGQQVIFTYNEMLSLLFIDRYEPEQDGENNASRDEEEIRCEATYMLDFLQESSLVRYRYGIGADEALYVTILPKGYQRIDELQKYTSQATNAFVAMQFGDETKALREAIRKGIDEAGYHPVFIDEVQHNEFITPEIMMHIRQCRFVVVDLTHQNNGAYFEEGYAMGVNKPVIQLCKNGTKLHFDIAQKNTIMWETEDCIPKLLCNRIKATID